MLTVIWYHATISDLILLALIATATPNVLTAVLKHIDPKLRPPKKGSKAISSLNANQEEDTMKQ